MPGKTPPTWTMPLVGSVLIGVAITAVPLARGGVDLFAELGATTLVFAAFLLVTRAGAVLPVSSIALIAVLAVAVAQILPVPPDVHVVSPGAVRIFTTSLSPLGLYPATRPLSLDPVASGRGVARSIACLLLFVSAYSVAATARRRSVLEASLALSGIAISAVVLGAALAGAGTFVTPRFPFVNPNHLAAALNLSAFVALALSIRAHGAERALWAIGFAVVGAVSFLAVSRGGFLAFVFGATVFVIAHHRTGDDASCRRTRRPTVAVAAAFVAAFGTAAFLALDPILTKLQTLGDIADDPRVGLIRPALLVIRDFPLLGVGRGAFPSVFAGYQLESAAYSFTHVENEWLQQVLDLGVPAGLVLVGTFFLTWFGAARRTDLSTTDAGLLAGTSAVAIHNFVDFSLGVLGVALPFVTAMGLLARGQRATYLPPRWVRFGALGAALLCATTMLIAHRHGEGDDDFRISSSGTISDAIAAAAAAAERRPADWVPHAAVGGLLSAAGQCGAAMPWLVRAMTLYPSAAAPHLGAARCLAGRDDVSAKREYRLAILFGLSVLGEAASRYAALEDLLEIAPDTPDGLMSLGNLLARDRPRDAVTVYRRVLDDFGHAEALLPLARLEAGSGNHAEAVELAQRCSLTFPTQAESYVIAARSLAALRRDDDARAAIERGLSALPGSPRLLNVLADSAIAARRWGEARRLAETIAPRGAADVAEKHMLIARTFAAQERISEALDHARTAEAAAPDSVPVLTQIAAWCDRLGRYDEAIDALRHAAAVRGDHSAFAAEIAGLEASRAARNNRAEAREDVR